MKTNKQTILYIDDDADDREFFAEVVVGLNHDANLQLAKNGFEAQAMLNEKAGDQPPSLIVIDLNMPGINGKGMCEWIQQQARLKQTPLFVFTASDSVEDKIYFAQRRVAMFTKPSDYYESIEVIKGMYNAAFDVRQQQQ